MLPDHDVLILGTSCRAAAFSALRSGLRPLCADYFADRDLAEICTVERIDPLSGRRDFLRVAESLPPSPWFYTGGFENRPAWVEQIARRHHLWGASAQSLRFVRNPTRIAALLHAHGIPVPAVRRDPQGLPRDGSWLIKPVRSGGGRGIRPLLDEHAQSYSGHYFQERIVGPSFSAFYIGTGEQTRLVGVTQQLLGVPGSPFGYRGSIGPWPLDETLTAKLRRLGAVLASASGLLGWFGIDFALKDDEPWPIEVNPRYTASTEIHELASGHALLPEHRAACAAAQPYKREITIPRKPRIVAKLIMHASRELIAPEIAPGDHSASDRFELREIADVPWPGTRFAAGDPVITLMAWGEDLPHCQSRMDTLHQDWTERLGFAAE